MESKENIANEMKMSSFNEDLHRTLKKLADRHGLKVPPYNVSVIDKAMFFNITVYNTDPKEQYKQWFIEQADRLGLSPDIVGKTILNHDKSKTLTILGLDPDGGINCIRLEDEKKEHFHLSPAAILKLLAQ